MYVASSKPSAVWSQLEQRVAALEKSIQPERVVPLPMARKEIKQYVASLKASGVTSVDVFDVHDALSLPYAQISRVLAELERSGRLREQKD